MSESRVTLDGMDLPCLSTAEDEMSCYLDKTWVQCESATCLKWRLVWSRDGDRLDPERPWHCHMNPDPFFSQCSVPQEAFPKSSQLQEHGLKVVYSQLPVGGLVMVKAGKWPWWPAVLSPDPASAEYVQRDSDGDVVKYHVEFLGSPRSRLWTSAKSLQLYQLAAAELKTLKSLQKSYDVALAEAAEMRNMTCEQRLKLCLFKPQELLHQAERLMLDIEKTIRQCNSQPSQSIHKKKRSSHMAGEREWIGEDRVEELGDTLIINGIIFRSGRSLEEIRGPAMERRV